MLQERSGVPLLGTCHEFPAIDDQFAGRWLREAGIAPGYDWPSLRCLADIHAEAAECSHQQFVESGESTAHRFRVRCRSCDAVGDVAVVEKHSPPGGAPDGVNAVPIQLAG